MTRFGKSLAALLALMLLGTPLVGLANCSPKLAMAEHCGGGEDCPMMMHVSQQTSAQVSGTPWRDGSCCQMKSLPPGTSTPATAPEGQVQSPIIRVVASAQVARPADYSARASGAAPPVPVFPIATHVLLCTFLV